MRLVRTEGIHAFGKNKTPENTNFQGGETEDLPAKTLGTQQLDTAGCAVRGAVQDRPGGCEADIRYRSRAGDHVPRSNEKR